jgi:TPR repeat protein
MKIIKKHLIYSLMYQNHILAQYYIGLYYQFGYGTIKNEKLAFKYYEKIANKNCPIGLFKIGFFFTKNGI